MRIYKSITARELFKRLVQGAALTPQGAVGRRVLGLFFWTSSYLAATVGQFGGYESVKRYVEEQGQTPEDRGRRRRI